MANEREKPPSELSLDLFAARVAADEMLPPSVRNVVADNKDKPVEILLAAINKAIGAPT